MIFCLSSCDVVTFAVRIATFRIFECLINPAFTSENECHKTPESQIQNSHNIKNLLDWGKISIAALEGELQQDLLSQHFAVTDKTWTNARNSQLSTFLKDTLTVNLFTPQKLHSHCFKFRLGITLVQRKKLINNGYKILGDQTRC